jgi:hypothetical protein
MDNALRNLITATRELVEKLKRLDGKIGKIAIHEGGIVDCVDRALKQVDDTKLVNHLSPLEVHWL